MSVLDCVWAEEQNLEMYLGESIEPLMVAANEILNEKREDEFESGVEYKERVYREREREMREW